MELSRTGENITLRFSEDETAVLHQLLTQMEAVLRSDSKDDPVRSRLFPNAYEAADDQRAYEELVGDQLRDEKLRALQGLTASLSNQEVRLSKEDADAWLVVLTDLRLALGTRLNVTEDLMGDELDPEDPEAGPMVVLHWLGWVQESLLDHLSD